MEFRKQAENFLVALQADSIPGMGNASIRLEAILEAVKKITTGKAELHRVIFPKEDDHLRGLSEGETSKDGGW